MLSPKLLKYVLYVVLCLIGVVSRGAAILYAQDKPAIDALHDPSDDDMIFQLGVPDARSGEFRLGLDDWRKAREEKGEKVWRQIIGETPDKLWPARHFSTMEYGGLGYRYALEIQFESARDYDKPLCLVVGISFSHWSEPSLICVSTNGVASEKVRQPIVAIDQPGQLKTEAGSITTTSRCASVKRR